MGNEEQGISYFKKTLSNLSDDRLRNGRPTLFRDQYR